MLKRLGQRVLSEIAGIFIALEVIAKMLYEGRFNRKVPKMVCRIMALLIAPVAFLVGLGMAITMLIQKQDVNKIMEETTQELIDSYEED